VLQKTESNATQVVLTKLELEAAGEYRCEVSADAPSFHTAIVSATMDVVGKCLSRSLGLAVDADVISDPPPSSTLGGLALESDRSTRGLRRAPYGVSAL